MRLLVDSSFFMPFIAVAIKEFPRKAILELIENEDVIRSDLVLFELSAKGSKLVNNEKLSIEKLTRGITKLQYQEKIEIIPIHYTEIQLLACELRKSHSDHIDCLMVATAVHYAEGMLTLDKELKKKAYKEWNETIKSVNKEFKVMLWDEYKK